MADTPTITYLSGPQTGQTKSFNEGDKIFIGRDKGNTIVLDGPDNKKVSRQHAHITFDGGMTGDLKWFIVDQSTNGTILNGETIKKESLSLSNGDILSFSKDRQDIKIEIDVIRPQEGQVDSGTDDTSPSFTKIMPTAKSGFLEEVLSQPFFIPGVTTIITGVLLFVVLIAGMEAQDLQYFVYYQTILGIYLGTMMIYFVVAVSAVKIPIWFLFGTSLFMVLLLSLGIPYYLLSTFFISPLIDEFMKSDIFLELFIGHFVGAGLLEELFKSIPVWLVIFLGSRFANLNLPGFVNGRPNPTVAILIGTASAVGFIILETLGQYVPSVDDPFDLAYGLMLLIPRFITGMAGHVGWSGIFAYYIALGFYYKRVNIVYPLIGWMLASFLHGLWNSTAGFSVLLNSTVAICTFIIFIMYLYKSKNSFPIQ